MSKTKNQSNTNACGGGGYKPLIATSLALALGMSEVSAGEGIKLTQSGDINGGSIDTPVEFQITSANDSIAGILVKPESLSEEIIATLKGDVIITSKALQDPAKNRYGIYVDNGGKTSFISDDSVFRTITTEEIVSLESGKEAYVFKNAGSEEVEFTKVGLVAGEKKDNFANFGVYSSFDGANYQFGQTVSSVQGDRGYDASSLRMVKNGGDAHGFMLGDSISMQGGIIFSSVIAGNGGNCGSGIETRCSDGAKGGSAYGISMIKDGTLVMGSSTTPSSIIFKSIQGGNGGATHKQAGKGGDAGNAYGIYMTENGALTIKGNGIIQIKEIAEGIRGGEISDSMRSTTQGVGKVYILNNISEDKSITFGVQDYKDSHITLIVGEMEAKINRTVYGIYSNLFGASYNFGDKVGTKFYLKGDDGVVATDLGKLSLDGESVVGIFLGKNASFAGNLFFGAKAGNNSIQDASDKNIIKGGDAHGLYLSDATLNLGDGLFDLNGSSIDLDITSGGNGSSYGIYAQGNSRVVLKGNSSFTIKVRNDSTQKVGVDNKAVGILVGKNGQNSSKFTIDGVKTLVLSVGDSTNTSVAFGLKLEDGVFAGDLDFISSSISAADKAYGIYSSGESAIEDGTIKFSSADSIAMASKKYILFNEREGKLTIASGAQIVNATMILGDSTIDMNYTGIVDMFGGSYAFGGNMARVGTQVNGKDAATATEASIVGMYFNSIQDGRSITLGGGLGVRGGNTTGAKEGGNATGLAVNMFDIWNISEVGLVIDKTGLALKVEGGNAKQTGDSFIRGGLATGLHLTTEDSKKITVSGGDISLVLSNGQMRGNIRMGFYPNALVHSGLGSVVFDGVTLYNLSSIGEIPDSLGRRFGIYNAASAEYDFGSDGGHTTFKRFTADEGEQAVGIYSSANYMLSAGELVFAEIVGGAGQPNPKGNGGKGGDAVGMVLKGQKYCIEYYGKVLMTVTGGQGGDGNAENGKKGGGGDAYGLIVDSGDAILELEGETELLLKVQGGAPAKTGRSEGVAGNAVGIFIENVGDKGTEKDGRFQFDSYPDSSIKLQIGNKEVLSNNKDAYGLKLHDSVYEGVGISISFDGRDSWVAANSGNGKAYAVYSSGESVIEDGAVIIAKDGLLGEEKYALYNDGHLTLGELARIIAGSKVVANANLYASDGAALDTFFGSGSTTVFGADRAFGSDESGAVNITLANSAEKGGAKIVFEGNAGNLGMLKGSNAGIILAGANQKMIMGRMSKNGFNPKKITITDMQLKDSTFVLAAKTNGGKVADSIHISGSKAADVQNNNIAIILDKYSTDPTPVTLATVSKDAKDKAIFNGLTESGMSAKSVTYSGFTTAEVMITREEGENGGVKYVSTLESAGTSINADVIAPTTVALSTSMSVFSVNLNSLSKRMGELRDDLYSHGVWARVFAGEQISDFGAKQAMVYTTLQVGYDYRFDFENADNYLGAAISYIKGSGGKVSLTHKSAPTLISEIISELTSCNTNGVEIAIYNSYIAHSGFYSDSVMKLGYFGNTLSLYAQPQTYKTQNFAFALSEEVGYRFALGKNNEWFITPQGELSLGYVGESAFTQRMFGEEMDSRQEGVMIFRSRVGSAWGYDFSHLMQKFKISVYMGTYYVYDCFVGGDTFLKAFSKMGEYVTLRDNAYKGSGRFAANLGANVSVKERVKVYADFEKSFGGSIQTNYQISLGVRFGFGEKTSAPKLEERKTAGDVLKPKELQKAE